MLKKILTATMMTLFLLAGCANEGSQATEATDTAAQEEEKKDFATRVGDTVGTATANADEIRKDESERVREVNEAMDE